MRDLNKVEKVKTLVALLSAVADTLIELDDIGLKIMVTIDKRNTGLDIIDLNDFGIDMIDPDVFNEEEV